MHMSSDVIPRLVADGHPMLCRLAASPCQCRSKTQLLTNVSYSAEQLYCLDQAGLGGQCIVPTTVNLGLTIHTGWTCQMMNETMVKVQLQTSLVTLLSKQLAKFRMRLAAAKRANLSIHMKMAETGCGPSMACLQQGEVDPRGSGGTLSCEYSAGEMLKAPVPSEP